MSIDNKIKLGSFTVKAMTSLMHFCILVIAIKATVFMGNIILEKTDDNFTYIIATTIVFMSLIGVYLNLFWRLFLKLDNRICKYLEAQ